MLRRTFFLPIPLLAALASVATADTVPAGFDLFRTDPSGTYIDFSLDPIPADFFGPGSDHSWEPSTSCRGTPST